MSTQAVHTFCRICEPYCGLLAQVEDGRILSLRSDKDHPIHKGFSCHKGIQYLRVHQDPDPEELFRFGVQNDDGLIDCCPPLFRRGYASAEEHWQGLLAEPKDQLKLITRRTPLMVNSWMNNLPVHKKSVQMTASSPQ